jgi:hypothetical protein
MNTKQVLLDFGSMTLVAELFDSPVATEFFNHLPCTIRLEKWGCELYGSIDIHLGEENPLPDIPPGGLAYTGKGNYFCIFFGQTPAWPVEHIGQIEGGNWKKLIDSAFNSVTVKPKP